MIKWLARNYPRDRGTGELDHMGAFSVILMILLGTFVGGMMGLAFIVGEWEWWAADWPSALIVHGVVAITGVVWVFVVRAIE